MDLRVSMFQLLYKLGEVSNLSLVASEYGKELQDPQSNMKGVLFTHQVTIDYNKTEEFSIQLMCLMRDDFSTFKKLIRQICFRIIKRTIAISAGVDCIRLDKTQIRITVIPTNIPHAAMTRLFCGLYCYGESIVSTSGIVTRLADQTMVIVRYLYVCPDDGYEEYVTRNKNNKKCRDCGNKLIEDVTGRLLIKSITFTLCPFDCPQLNLQVEMRSNDLPPKIGDQVKVTGEFHGTILRALFVNKEIKVTNDRKQFDSTFKSLLNLLEFICPGESQEVKRLVYFGMISLISNESITMICDNEMKLQQTAMALKRYLDIDATTPNKSLTKEKGFLTLKKSCAILHADLSSNKMTENILNAMSNGTPYILLLKDPSKFSSIQLCCRVFDVINLVSNFNKSDILKTSIDLFRRVSVDDEASLILTRYSIKSGCDAVPAARANAAMRGSATVEKLDAMMAVYVCEEKKNSLNSTSFIGTNPSKGFLFFNPSDSIIPSNDEILLFNCWSSKVECFLEAEI